MLGSTKYLKRNHKHSKAPGLTGTCKRYVHLQLRDLQQETTVVASLNAQQTLLPFILKTAVDPQPPVQWLLKARLQVEGYDTVIQ